MGTWIYGNGMFCSWFSFVFLSEGGLFCKGVLPLVYFCVYQSSQRCSPYLKVIVVSVSKCVSRVALTSVMVHGRARVDSPLCVCLCLSVSLGSFSRHYGWNVNFFYCDLFDMIGWYHCFAIYSLMFFLRLVFDDLAIFCPSTFFLYKHFIKILSQLGLFSFSDFLQWFCLASK